MRYRLTVAYDGTEFHGWQIQPDARTVQGEIESAVQRVTGETVRVAAAGRTDAGVHACGQVISFALRKDWQADTLARALNAVTGDDLSLREAAVVADDFDPRRHASAREYVYRLWNERWQSPFWRRYAWQVFRPLSLEPMQLAAATLLGEHDFTSLRAAGCDADSPIRRVHVSELHREEGMISYRVVATAFLRHMVRNIVGTLVEVGLGIRPSNSIESLLAERNRDLAGATAPAHGLALTRVHYGPTGSAAARASS